MRIGIDARFAVHNRRGIGNYTLNLIRYLASIDKTNEYFLYVDGTDREGVLPKQRNFKIIELHPSNYLVWEQVCLPRRISKDSIDVLHSTGNTAPLFIDSKIKLVVTIHDVMYLKDYSLLPQSMSMYQRLGRLYRKNIVPPVVQYASKVITVSNFSKQDILAHFPLLKADNVVVTYEAAAEAFSNLPAKTREDSTAKKYGVNGEYIFVLGALDPRKNTKMVIEVFLALKSEGKINSSLVIAGIPKWRTSSFCDIVSHSPYRDSIIFTEYITQSELVSLYQGAKVFLYPSLYEGFGIPPLEAMSCSTPVITSNSTSIPEVVGDAAVLIDPGSAQELREKLLLLLTDESFCLDLIARGCCRAKAFSWEKMAMETSAVYQEIYSSQASQE